MDKDATLYAGDLRQLVVADTAPLLWQCLPAFEALRRDWDSLYAPVTSSVFGVEDVKRFLSFRDSKGRL